MKTKQSLLVLTLLLAANPLFGREEVDCSNPQTCEEARYCLGAPYFYCDCSMNSRPFAFPVEEEITDTVWYTASVDDLKKGISAYWFADCSVTMEVYAMCTSKSPTISLTIGKNQMRDVDVAKINEKLSEMGETAQELLGALTPHIRVYPNGGSGKVYCYPYNEGPASTCDEPLPLRPGMTYVCSNTQSAYKMEWNLIPTSGNAFIHWKQEKNLSCEIWLTLDSCNGEEVGRAKLTDSLHVYFPNQDMLKAARTAKRTLWLHAKHAKDITGRLYWRSNPKYYEEALKAKTSSTCLGKTIKVNLRTYESDTTFTDTLWVVRDSLTTQQVKLTFEEPTLEYDTIQVLPSVLARGYRYTPSGDILYTYNDTIVDIIKKNTCTRRVQVTIQDPTGLDYQSAGDTHIYKQLHNGQLFIIVDDRKYTILGQPVEQ